MALAPHVSPHGTVMAVSMMKDEAPYLLEWFAHHLAMGFTDILVYTNDCTDGTVEMLQRLEELGLGHHRPNDIPEGIKPQPSALKYAQEEPLVRAADWVMVFDADEFLCINHPSGTLDGMLDDAVAQGANGIVVTWRIFGSNGVIEWSRAPVTEQYTRAAPPLWNKGWGVKTLFRFDPEYWKLGIHRPSIKAKHLEDGFPDTVKWLNGSGQPMEDYFKFRGWRSIRRTLGYDWAQMNHYAIKSVDAYAIRKFRGNVNNKKDKYNADYWALQDRNEVPDTHILRHSARRAEIMAELLKDPVLAQLHEAALARIEARLAEYKTTEAYATLRDSLIAAGKVPITEVEAKPPQARDPARIAALMSKVEKTSNDKRAAERAALPKGAEPAPGWTAAGAPLYVPGRIDLSAAATPEWVPNQEIDLPADPHLFSPEAVMAVLAGKFDRRHARNIEGYLTGCRRVLDLGAGIALAAMKAVRTLPGLTVMAQDSQPGMSAAVALIRARAGDAGAPRLRFVDGPLRFAGDGEGKAGGLSAYLKDFQPDALRISARSGITPDELAAQDPGRIARVIVPFETEAARDDLRRAFGPVLRDRGFIEAEERAEAGSLQYDRSKSGRPETA